MYPPKFCSFKDPSDPTFPSHLKESNLVGKIDELNKKIHELNTENTENRHEREGILLLGGTGVKGREFSRNGFFPQPSHGTTGTFGMHSYGIRHLGSGGEPIGKREHRWSVWFEEEDERKLHLTHEWRANVLHRIQLYFIHNTDW